VRVLWSEGALQHLAAIYQYIAQTSPIYAEGVVDRIGTGVDNSESFLTPAARSLSTSDQTFARSSRGPIA